jgi:hypothetical protein
VLKSATSGGLLTCHADVDKSPEDEPGSELVEGFYVERPDRRVEFSSDEKL